MDKSAQTLTVFDQLLDLITKVDRGDSLEPPQQTIDRAEQFAKSYDGSLLDLYLTAESLANIADTIQSKIKEDAYSEAELLGIKEKLGVEFYTRESHKRYDYPDDKYINKVQQELDAVKKQLKPLEKEAKGLKDSIKDRQKKLEKEGKAQFKGSSKSIIIKK